MFVDMILRSILGAGAKGGQGGGGPRLMRKAQRCKGSRGAKGKLEKKEAQRKKYEERRKDVFGDPEDVCDADQYEYEPDENEVTILNHLTPLIS